MFTGSAMHEMGTALRLAQRNDWPVEVLLEGRWLYGRIDSLDGHRVALHSRQHDHPVTVSLELITLVRVLSARGRPPMAMRRLGSV